jgi:hypothetical protein
MRQMSKFSMIVAVLVSASIFTLQADNRNGENDRLDEGHGKNIVEHWPDGRTTVAFDFFIEALRGAFFAPDTRIEAPPIGDGKFIEPIGKPYKLTMATIGHWNNEGVKDENYAVIGQPVLQETNRSGRVIISSPVSQKRPDSNLGKAGKRGAVHE